MFFSTDVFASANLNELDSINDSIDETQNYGTEDGSNIFNNKTIKVCEYIYNLDDSADYIYIEFNEGGYVMLVANSFEIMEYSLQGNLPYTNFENKNYYWHTGWIGGLKSISYKEMMEKNPQRAMTLAVNGMLPNNSQGRNQIKRLRTYRNAAHKHEAQKPVAFEL